MCSLLMLIIQGQNHSCHAMYYLYIKCYGIYLGWNTNGLILWMFPFQLSIVSFSVVCNRDPSGGGALREAWFDRGGSLLLSRCRHDGSSIPVHLSSSEIYIYDSVSTWFVCDTTLTTCTCGLFLSLTSIF